MRTRDPGWRGSAAALIAAALVLAGASAHAQAASFTGVLSATP
jgi:hypothetical protein